MDTRSQILGRFMLLKELWLFMRVRKKYWLAPILLVLLLLGVFILATSNPAIAPFIYTLF